MPNLHAVDALCLEKKKNGHLLLKSDLIKLIVEVIEYSSVDQLVIQWSKHAFSVPPLIKVQQWIRVMAMIFSNET